VYHPKFHLKTTEERKALARLAAEPDKEVFGNAMLQQPHLKETVQHWSRISPRPLMLLISRPLGLATFWMLDDR